MKVVNVVLLLIILMAVGCKTQKIAPKPEPMKSETVVKSSDSSSPSVRSKEERVTAAKGEANDLGSKRFYIILGSFGVYENAQKFKKQLMAEDFFPGILVNEASGNLSNAAHHILRHFPYSSPNYDMMACLIFNRTG